MITTVTYSIMYIFVMIPGDYGLEQSFDTFLSPKYANIFLVL